MLKNIWLWVLANVFKIKTETTDKEINDNQDYSRSYQDVSRINFNAIFSNKLGKYTANDSTIEVVGENQRAELVKKVCNSMWKKMAKISSMAFGYGGVLIIPYIRGGKIYYNIIPQSRLTIDEMNGDIITGATIIAERKIINSGITQTEYIRWTNYQIQNNTLIITQQYTNGEGKTVDIPYFWQDIQQVQSITNVDRVPFGYIKSPINNRKSDDKYGVPITYGCEATIQEIRECLEQIAQEFELKKSFVMMDKTAFGNNDKLPISRLFKKADFGADDFWQIFDPTIRDSSYYARLQELFARLEKEIGTSRGILTDPLSNYQNTDETKRALYDTISIVNSMRENIEQGLEDFFYSCNILANAYNLTTDGEFEIKYDWDFGLIESTTDTWQQLTVAHSKGIVKDEELRQFIYPSEQLELAKKTIQEIKEKNPSIESLLGITGEE